MSDINSTTAVETKFCKECGQRIAKKAVICPMCGCQVEETATAQSAPQIVINNSNQNANTNNNVNAGMMVGARLRNKWVAIALCLFLGFVGGHKFYEGKIVGGLLYACTGGMLLIGVILDFLALLGKPNPYMVV